MEDSAIKSPAGSSAVSYKISDEGNSKTKTIPDAKLPAPSVNLVDKYKYDEKTDDNPVWNCQNKIETELNSPVGRIHWVPTYRTTSPVDDNQAIVKKLFKNPEMTVVFDEGNIPLVAKNDNMSKPVKNQATSIKQTGNKVEPKLTRSRRIPAEKLIPYSGLILRSGRKRVLEPRANGSKDVKIVNENKSRSAEKGNKSVENCIGTSSGVEKKKSEPDPDPLGRVDGKKETTPHKAFSLMDKILSESKVTMADVNRSNSEDKAIHKTALEGLSTNTEKKAVEPKKRRKCSVLLKSERVQTRQSRSIPLTRAQTDFKYLTQRSSPLKGLATSKDGQKVDKEGFDETHSNKKKAPIHTEISSGQRSSEDVFQALNLTNQKNVAKCKMPPDRKRVADKENDPKAERKVPQTSKKRGPENPKQKAGHVNAQAMPVYVSKIAVAKDSSQSSARKSVGSDGGIKVLKILETGEDDVGESRTTPESKSETLFNTISLLSRTSRSTDQRDGNIDSDGTLSNVESVPNSPAKEPWQNVAEKRVKPSDKLDSGQNNSLRSSATLKDVGSELRSPSTSKQTNEDISRSRIDDSEPRFYVEASEKGNDDASDIANHSQPWLRHYERPPSKKKDAAKNRTGFADETKEGPTSTVENTASVNLFTPARKRGRPRGRLDTLGTETNPEKKKKPSTSNGTNTAATGSGLTLKELEQLFFKYFQDGHFRADPRQRPIIIYSNDLHQNFSSRIQCYDPRKYLPHPCNVQTTDSPATQFEHRMRTIDPNSQNFSNQPTIPPHTNSGQYGTGGNNFNNPAFTSPVSSYAQSGYGFAVNYQQNSGNSMGNNSYYNSCSMVTGTNSMSTGNGNEFNYSPHAPQLRQNLMPYREMDLTMNNGTNSSTNSMQNSPTNDITNSDWNEVNSALDSVNGILMDLNSMNQTLGGSPSLPNRTNDQNSTINGPNPWMNRSNGATNPPYPMMQPWRGSFPMYNSYLNNDSQYYNMFNPYSACMGFDAYSNNINARNGMGNNEHPWVQNYHANLGIGHSNFNGMIPQFSGPNSGYLQDNNNTNQGMNLSLSQNNSMELDDSVGQESRLNSSLEQPGVESINVESVQESARCYGSQMSPAYFSGYNKNDTANLDFGGVNVPNADHKREENQPQIPDYISERLASFEGCFQRYDSEGTSSGEIVAEVMNNREMEMSKLRQELADFTRQYSEDTSPISQIPQEDEIFDSIMSQDLQDTDESSSS